MMARSSLYGLYMFASPEPMLQISHSEDDLFFIGFMFDEVQTLEIENFCRDFVAMSFDQLGSTVVLDMMRSMSFMPGMGLRRRQHGPNPDGSRGHGEDVFHYRVRYCEPIFQLSRKSQPTILDDQCQRAFERIGEYLLSPPILVPPTPGRLLLLYLSISDIVLGCMLAQLDDSGKERAIYYLSKRMLDYETRYVMIEHFCLVLVWALRRLRHYMMEYSVHLISRLDSLKYLFDRPALIGRLMRWLVLLTEFDIHYVTQKFMKWSIVADHLVSLPIYDSRVIDDDFLDEDIAVVTSFSGWCMYFDGAANHSGYGISVLLISPHGDHIPRSIQGHWKTRDVKLRPYHAYLELLVGRFDDLSYTHLPRAHNQFADALATIASMIDIPVDTVVHHLLIESRSVLAYCYLIDEVELDDGLPWYHDIYQFLRLGIYLEVATTKDKKALR
ncbi:hypothetical protein VitviT2T_016964 [Vitis vinifera]|uniref:Reverse transcriptase RNase H-like domain-containing protein n=1 Tax=Vitis vinifera TaxID=29760 RepID=A0ABY9CST4_VITVI|nr:hypothetical protein VitviT2T_016964 [Vitis vinifera]